MITYMLYADSADQDLPPECLDTYEDGIDVQNAARQAIRDGHSGVYYDVIEGKYVVAVISLESADADFAIQAHHPQWANAYSKWR